METLTGIRGRAAAAVLASVLAVSCGGGGYSGGVMPPPPPPLEPTLASIQANIFTPSCALAGCHAGPSPQQGQNLSAGVAFSNIVNVASTEQPAFLRVEPGDPDNSYLYMKITGDPRISGDRMPRNAAPLSTAKIAAIHDWIANGAPAGTSFGEGGGGGYP